MEDRDRILQFLKNARSDPDREPGRRLDEIARELELSIERTEFLVYQLEKERLVSLSIGDTAGQLLVDVGQAVSGGA